MANSSTLPAWSNTLEQSSASAGVSSDVLRRISSIEYNPKGPRSPGTSSATGIFQFTQGTWANLQKLRPSLALGDRNDDNEQARAAPFQLAANNSVIRDKIGREPTPGEQYLGWFAGAGAAPGVITAAPSTPVTSLFSTDALKANASLFAKHPTAGSLRAWAETRMGGAPAPTDAAHVADLAAAPAGDHPGDNVGFDTTGGVSMPDVATRLAAEVKQNENQWSTAHALGEAFWNEGATKWALDAIDNANFTPDPKFSVSYDMLKNDKRLAGIPEQYWEDLLPSQSKGEYDNRVQTLLDDTNYQNKMAELGFKGSALRFVGGALDPSGWLVGAVSPLGDIGKAEQVGRLGYALLAGTDAAIGNTLVDIPKLYNQPTYDPKQIAYTAAGSFLFGSMIGGLLHGGIKPSLAKDLTDAQTGATGVLRTLDAAARGQTWQESVRAGLDKLGDVPYSGEVGRIDSLPVIDSDVFHAFARKAVAERELSEATAADAAIKPADLELLGTHNKLNEIESKLADDNISPEDRKALQTQRESILDVTKRETLQDHANRFTAKGFLQERIARLGREVSSLSDFAKAHTPEGVNVPHNFADAAADAEVRRAAAWPETAPQTHAGSVGAASNAGNVEPVRADVPVWAALGDWVSKKTDKLDKLDPFSLSSKTRQSQNPVTAILSPHLIENAVGNADGSVNARASSNVSKYLHETKMVSLLKRHEAAFKDYAKRNGIGWSGRRQAQLEFNAKVLDYIEERNAAVAEQYDPAIKAAGNAHRDMYAKYLELAKNPGVESGETFRPLQGAAETEADPHYVPHIWDFFEMGRGMKRFGDKGMITLFREALRPSFAGKDLAKLDRVAESFYKALKNVGAGQEQHVSGLLASGSRDGLAQFLRESGVEDGDIRYIVDRLKPEEKAGGAPSRLKARQPLDPSVSVPLQVLDNDDADVGKIVNVSPKEFMQRDAIHVATSYSRQLSARVGLARLRIEDPRFDPELHDESARYLVDGITKDSEWETLMKQVQAVGAHVGQSRAATNADVDRLNFSYRTILGRLDPFELTKVGGFLRIVRNLNFARMMGQVAWAQMAESGVALGQMGWRAALSQMPTLSRLLRDTRTGLYKDDVWEQISTAFAPEADLLMQRSHLLMDDFGSVVEKRGKIGVAEDVSRRIAHAVSVGSGMSHITAAQRMISARMALARFAMDATGQKALNAQRLAVMGIDGDMAKKIQNMLQTHDGFIEGTSGTKLRKLNLDNWDADARYAFTHAISNWTRRVVQENDVGQMNAVLGTTAGKILNQFRTFMFGAYAKNTLHNLRQRDWESASQFLISTVLGGLTYAAQTKLQSIGRSDEQQFLDKRLDTKSLVTAALQRAPITSVLPMVTDNVLYPLGIDPIFDNRVSGTPSQGVFSNPTFQLLDTIQKAGRGITRSTFTNEQFSQRDARAVLGLLPFGNMLPTVMLSNSLISGLPEEDTHRVNNQ